MRKYRFIVFFLSILLAGCSDISIPKPKGYNYIDLPAHAYQPLEIGHPFSFEYSKFAIKSRHKSPFAEPDWMDLKYSKQHCTIELTYKDIKKDKKGLQSILTDSYKLTNKHDVKAYAIDQTIIKTKNGYTATLFDLQGDVPSQVQFFVTDSVQHFLRGALYFPVSTKNDSLAPVISYVRKDIIHLLETLEWNNPNKEAQKIN